MSANNYNTQRRIVKPHGSNVGNGKYEDQKPNQTNIERYVNGRVPYQCNANGYRILPDFNILALMEEYPNEVQDGDAKKMELLDDEEIERMVENIKLIRSVRNKQRSVLGQNYWEEDDMPSDDEETNNFVVVWDKPYFTPPSVLKKSNSPAVKKPTKKVCIITPPTHKAGYHPVRTITGGVCLKRRNKRPPVSMREIRRRANQYLFDQVLAPEYYNRNSHVKPICLSEFFFSLECGHVDFVIIVNCGPEDFFVRIGHLEFRRRFNYMECEMKEWYTRKRGLMVYCATTLQDAEFLSYYVMFHSRFGEYVRVQISSPVEKDMDKNPNGIVIVALIDYGGHLYAFVGQLLPLMPYFAQFPKMAFRGVLALTKNLEKVTGRATYTENEKRVFQNLIADYNGIVEAVIAKPENVDDLEKYNDNENFGIVELILFVMSNGKRKTVDEIVLNEQEHSAYLQDESHYPTLEEFQEEQEELSQPILVCNYGGRRK